MPESPVYLVKVGRFEEAKDSWDKIAEYNS
jgi:hypothetical protein